jgi:DNA-binding NarL/FixJ family response regulator
MAFAFPLRVLVVDDHIGIRIGIARLVDAEFPRMHTVGVAATVAEALAAARQHRPDVVVLDVNLDGEDGLALIPALQQMGPCQVVVLTSLSDPRVATLARGLGAYACLQKTAPASELLACLENARIAAEGNALTAPASRGGDLSQVLGSKHP